jgi:hypothetical protein
MGSPRQGNYWVSLNRGVDATLRENLGNPSGSGVFCRLFLYLHLAHG